MLRMKNWSSYQSYKDRRPPWIRLHKSLLDSFDFHGMSVNARALLPMLWLLASEDGDPVSGLIRDSYEKVSFRLRVNLKDLESAIDEIIKAGFIEYIQYSYESVTEPLQNRNQTVTPEKRREEAEKSMPPKKTRGKKTDIPDNFSLSENVKKWGIENGHSNLEAHLDAFKRKVAANGYQYIDWDSAFMEAVRQNWAKIDPKKKSREGVVDACKQIQTLTQNA